MTLVSNRSAWHEALAVYAQPRLRRGLLDIVTSAVPYLALCVAMYLLLRVSPLMAVALVIPTAGFLVRVFVVFHDCTHDSLLPSRGANRWAGRVLGLFVLSTFYQWRREHAGHHATSGDLDRRGEGDVETLTVAEYQARPWRGRLAYRLFRHPLVMFGLGPVFAMLIEPRLVRRGTRSRMRNSVLGTDAALAVIVAALCWLIGWEDLLIVWAPPALLAGSVGIWLFYVQHQFENVNWQRHDEWSYADAALRGSSHLKLPKLLQFFTANIGLHHVHHLNSRIPNYNLQRAHDTNVIFAGIPTVSIRDGAQKAIAAHPHLSSTGHDLPHEHLTIEIDIGSFSSIGRPPDQAWLVRLRRTDRRRRRCRSQPDRRQPPRRPHHRTRPPRRLTQTEPWQTPPPRSSPTEPAPSASPASHAKPIPAQTCRTVVIQTLPENPSLPREQPAPRSASTPTTTAGEAADAMTPPQCSSSVA